MARTIIQTFLLLVIWSCQNGTAQDARILPEKLKGIPHALVLTHSPNPVFPELNTNGDAQYVWKHYTCISTQTSGLQVIEVGSFIWIGSGWRKNMYLKTKDVLKRFKMPSKTLEPGKIYCYEDNNRYGDVLFGGDALWYVITQDRNGQKYKAYGIVETEKELKN